MRIRAVNGRTIRRGLRAVALLALTLTMASATESRAQSSGGFLGVTLQDLDAELRSSYGLRRPDGVLIADVQREGPAETAGIRRGDVLLRVAGATIASTSDVIERVGDMSPGETAVITVWRGNREITYRVPLAERPGSSRTRAWVERREDRDAPHGDRDETYGEERDDDDGDIRVFEWKGDGDQEGGDFDFHSVPMPDLENLRDAHALFTEGRGRLGVRTQDLNEQLGAYFQVPDGKGVLVVEVMDETPAQKAGVFAGDVILGIGGTSVASTSELQEELRSRDEGPVQLEVVRRGKRQSLTAELEKPAEPRRLSLRVPRAPEAPRAPHRKRIELRTPRGDLHFAPRPPAGERRNMARDLDRLRREMRQLERQMEQMRRELRDDD